MMARLETALVAGWPKLAWVAAVKRGTRAVLVHHGPMVEVAGTWIAEAVWVGDYSCGDFDRTDLVFGTGVRVRDGSVVFVTSATGVDRLWHCDRDGTLFVSNSLPGLLALSGVSLREDYKDYVDDLRTVERVGIRGYTRVLPAEPVSVEIVYLENLVYDGSRVSTIPKPGFVRDFTSFDRYRAFLSSTAVSLGQNLRDPLRRHPVVPLTTISRGYDSPAASVIAKEAGCTQAVTIANTRSIPPGSDDGSRVARRLGLTCKAYRHHPQAYRLEETIWAASGRAGGLNMTILDYTNPLCLLFTGAYGDTIWDARYHDLSEPRGDSDFQLGEFRLFLGVFHCVVPWWGIKQAQQINRLAGLDEMKQWCVGGAYDRPVARRIVEEAGVPREAFGRRKRVTASNTPFGWPYSRKSRRSFRAFLRRRGVFAPPEWLAWLLRWIALADHIVYLNLTKHLGFGKGWRPWWRLQSSSLVFLWANEVLKRRYCDALEAASGGPGSKVGLSRS